MNIVVSGTRGEGKSTLSLYLARQFADTIVIVDPRGTYSAVGIECFDVDELLDHIDEQDYLPSKDNGITRPLPLVMRFDGPTPAMFSDVAVRLFPLYFRFKGKVAIVIDEARELQSPHWIDEQLNRLVRQGPMSRLCVIQNTHQMMDWNSATKSVTDDFYIFRQLGPRNYKVMSEHFGPDIAEIAANLPLHHLVHCYFDRRNGSDQTHEIWDDPSVWYEPISNESNKPELLETNA